MGFTCHWGEVVPSERHSAASPGPRAAAGEDDSGGLPRGRVKAWVVLWEGVDAGREGWRLWEG